MASGFEFELSDGRILQIVPKDGVDSCSISHGDTKIELDVAAGSFRVLAPSGKALTAISTIVRFEAKNLTVSANAAASDTADKPHIMRTCEDCNGQSCCVTNCCGSCGCGWICD